MTLGADYSASMQRQYVRLIPALRAVTPHANVVGNNRAVKYLTHEIFHRLGEIAICCCQISTYLTEEASLRAYQILGCICETEFIFIQFFH